MLRCARTVFARRDCFQLKSADMLKGRVDSAEEVLKRLTPERKRDCHSCDIAYIKSCIQMESYFSWSTHLNGIFRNALTHGVKDLQRLLIVEVVTKT